MKTEVSQQAANRHIRQIHYLLQWLVAIYLLNLAAAAWIAYKLAD